MAQHEWDWTRHEVSFGVWDREKCVGLLRVIPLGCHVSEHGGDPDSPRYAAYGIYVQVRVEGLGVECTGGDFVHPDQLRALLSLLKGDTPAPPAKALLCGDDGGIEIQFERSEEGYIAVDGRIPARGGTPEWMFSRDPLLLRTAMKTAVHFEFMLAPKQAIESAAELANLLAYVRTVEERESR